MAEPSSSPHSETANCPFCAWLQGTAPKPPVVFEDSQVIATLCESPISRGHTQIIYKTHYHELANVTQDDGARLGNVIPVISNALRTGLGAEMVYVACIAEEVRHVHFHLVPRYEGETKGFSHFTRERIKLENVEETLTAIRSHIFVKVAETRS